MHRQINGHRPHMKHISSAPHGSPIRVVPVLLLAGLYPAAPAAEQLVTELAPITVSAHGGSGIPYDQSGVSVTSSTRRSFGKKESPTWAKLSPAYREYRYSLEAALCSEVM